MGFLVGRTRDVGVKVGGCDENLESMKEVGDAASKTGDGVTRNSGMIKRINITSNTTRARRITPKVIIL